MVQFFLVFGNDEKDIEKKQKLEFLIQRKLIYNKNKN